MEISVVLPAAGIASRMKPYMITNKSMVILTDGMSAMQHNMADLDLISTKKTLVVIKDPHSPITKTLNSKENVEYVIQPKPLGIADAIRKCLDKIDTSWTLVCMPDTVFLNRGSIRDFITRCESRRADAFIGISEDEEETIKETSCCVINSSGRVIRVEEKPKFPQSKLRVSGPWLFPTPVLEKYFKIPKRNHGDGVSEITSFLIEEGYGVQSIMMGLNVNLNTIRDLHRLNALLENQK